MNQRDIVNGRPNGPNVGGPWKESLFGCFDDLPICCRGFFCTASSFGRNAKKIDDSSCVGMCAAYCLLTHCSLCWVPHMMKRKVLRQKYHLQEEPYDDCLVTAFCGPCAICQEARELKARAAPHGPNVWPVRLQQPMT